MAVILRQLNMLILGIDTSCDDTCLSVIKIPNSKSQIPKLEIVSNVISSQVKIHAKYGGVYPTLAKREHIKNLPRVYKKALRQAKIKPANLEVIAVTNGPGLEPCLWQGINFAKNLAKKIKKSLVPVNHLEAHVLANFLNYVAGFPNFFPAVCLVASGGHTILFLMKEVGKYRLLGETCDDAAGECFDKVARILGLGYPGGPIIAKMASEFKIRNSKFEIKLPRPMIFQKNYDFSFSGLKTAVLYAVKSEKRKAKSEEYTRAMCHEVQQAIIDVLIYKTIKAVKDFKVKSIILGGGVVANEELRRQFKSIVNSQLPKVKFLVPPKNLCTDNAAMVAATAYFHQKSATKNLEKIKANANLKI